MNFTVYFNTRKFELSHNKLPRGRGSWGFMDANRYDDYDYLNHVKYFNGTYAEAKKLARAYFASVGVQDVVVLP